MLYLIESTNYYKIGYTENDKTLRRRIKSYRTHNPNFIHLDTFSGNMEDERFLHILCKEYRVNNTEWFIKNSFILETIEAFKKNNIVLEEEINEEIEQTKIFTKTLKSETFYMTFIDYVSPLFNLKSEVAKSILT